MTTTTIARARLDASARLDALTTINSDDVLTAFGLGRLRHGRAVLRWLCRGPARRFALQVLEYDELVGRVGLQRAGDWLTRQLAPDLLCENAALLPPTGPLLIVANHPGLYDTMALLGAIARPDLRVVAADRPFLHLLPQTTRHLISVTPDAAGRMAALRASARHLRSGGAVLLFPSGRIEPDPALMAGAVAALDSWSESIALFGRLTPRLTILPAVVSDVLAPAALEHPLVALRRAPEDRHLLAATLQLAFPHLQRNPVRVAFGRPIRRDSLPATADAAVLHERVIGEVMRLIQQVPVRAPA